MTDKITIKELAEELGVSKQAIRKYFDKLPPRLVPTKENGRYLLNLELQEFIRNQVSTVGTNFTTLVDSEVDTLKHQIKHFETQLISKDEQINKLHELLNQQQQLQLKTQQMLEEKTLLLETAQKRKWWKFW